MGAIMGGNVRVGLDIATPAEARALLQLKGGDRVWLLSGLRRSSQVGPPAPGYCRGA
jgi:hypothetical protein